MKRQNLINRLVDRKLKTPGRGKVFCICFAARAGSDRRRPANPKN
jgi:hypothetical protein